MAIPPINFTGSSSAASKQETNSVFKGQLGGDIYHTPSMGQIAAIAGAIAAVIYVIKRAVK